MKTPDLSIIIVSFNTRQITKDCLESVHRSLKKSSFTYEILLVDNHSKDGSVEEIKKLGSKIKGLRVIENKENTGFGKANNQGVREAKGKCILLLNSDTVVLDSGIDYLYEFYKKNEDHIHFLGAKLFNRDMSPQPSCGPFYSLPVVLGALFLKGDYWGLTRYSPDALKKVDWVSGACIFTTKEHYEKLGGFDEGIFMYMEEIDLLHRAKKIGLKTYFYPSARFIHLGSASSGGKTYPILQVYTGFIYLYKKHASKFELLILKGMLQLKAVVSIAIGRITRNAYLIQTYEKALQLAQEN